MSNQKSGAGSYDQVFAEQQAYITKRASGYREQALRYILGSVVVAPVNFSTKIFRS